VLIDAFGSLMLSEKFWNSLKEAGGEVRWFNRLSLDRYNIRNHRKLIVADDQVAIVGGFNVAPVSLGDGVESGWRDLALRLTGPLVPELAASFDDLFGLADFRHRRLSRFRRSSTRREVRTAGGELLLSGPGRGQNLIREALNGDFRSANSVRIVAGYFLPSLRLRRAIARVAHRGGKVQLILAGKSDVPLMRNATQSLYQRFLRAGVEIYEYEPQVLHAKLLLFDRAVYVGSANLDVRSFQINYELMLRLTEPRVVHEAGEVFQSLLGYCRRIERAEWRKSRSFWAKLKERLALLIFARIDPIIAGRQLRNFYRVRRF
jgi:cardiolipin synthase